MALIEFNSEQKIIQNEIKKFTQAELEPIVSDIDRGAEFPVAVIEKLTELGFMGATIPDAFDGAGLDTTSLCIILEELARTSASVAVVIAIHNCCAAYPITTYGTSEQKDQYLPRLAAGTIGGCIMDSTLDIVKKFKTSVTDSTITITGTSDFTMNGAHAHLYTLPISVNEKEGIGIFERTNDMTHETYNLLGLRSAGIVRLTIPKVLIPVNDVIFNGVDGSGVFTSIMAYNNIGLAAVSLGIAESCFKAALEYAKERKQFNRAICEFPMVREMLVDMRTKIDAARFLVYDAARSCDNKISFSVAANNARIFSDETAVFAGTTSVQVHGGYGYTKDYPVERYFRDAKSVQVVGMHAYEIKEQIAKEILS